MQVTANGRLFSNILKQGIFTIPNFQRPFDWDIEQVSEFLDDINENIDQNYFIGHMVLTYPEHKNKYSGLTCYSIIDGQQRFTTITILLCVIRDIMHHRHKNQELKEAINRYLYTWDNDNNELPVLETEVPYPIFQQYIQTYAQEPEKEDLINSIENNKFKNFISNIDIKNESELKLLNAYNYFYSSLKDFDLDRLKKVRDTILALEVVFVEVEDLVSAHSVFMTLNAKGKDLTFIDLIKNHIFSKYDKTKKPAQPKYLEEIWKEIFSNIQSGGREEFFLAFWKSRYTPTVSREKFYKEYMQLTGNKQEKFDINAFVENLYNDSNIFCKITNPNMDDWIDTNCPKKIKIYFHLRYLINFLDATKLSYPFLLALLRCFNNKLINIDNLLSALNILEKYVFINNILYLKGTAGLNKVFPKYALKLFSAKKKTEVHDVINDFINQMRNKVEPYNEEIIDRNISKRIYYDRNSKKEEDKIAKRLARYCLERLEWRRQNNNFNIIDISIEHIYSNDTASSLKNTSDIDKIKTIGNLVLLEKTINSKIPNDYSEKREIILKESNLFLAKEIFSKHESWGISDIDNRNKKMSKEIYDMFESSKP